MGTFSSLLAVAIPSIPLTLSPCGLAVSLPCGGGGSGGLSSYTSGTIVPALETIFLAIAIAYFFYYAVRLMLESDEDSVISETKSAYSYAVAGCVVVSMAGLITQAIGPGSAQSTLINSAPVISGLGSIVLYMRLMVAASVSGVIAYQGMRMILLQGEEGEMSQQKKKFFNGLIGVAVVIMANVIVTGFLPSTGTSLLAIQIVGICNYLLEILGALCVLAFLYAGAMLVVSTDESLKDRAKKTMFTTTIALIVVLSSLILVNFVIGL